MNRSTFLMACNNTGLFSTEFSSKWGIVDYDWSNAKRIWIDHSPMDCDTLLVEQAARNKAHNPTTKVFVYRNIVKALPWNTQVRRLLQDKANWGWFLPYDGCLISGEYTCKNNNTGEIDASANLWHDEVQTPGWTGGGTGGPDGVCHGDSIGNTGKGCDCGAGVSCGGYIWDHRNASLVRWLTEQYIGGRDFGLGNPAVVSLQHSVVAPIPWVCTCMQCR